MRRRDCCTLSLHDACSPTGAEYVKVFDGECNDGDEIRMYGGGGDNPGSTAEERIRACSQACQTKKTPTEGSWDGFIAKGFAVILKGKQAGRCFCENADSATCKRARNAYKRFDWISPGLGVQGGDDAFWLLTGPLFIAYLRVVVVLLAPTIKQSNGTRFCHYRLLLQSTVWNAPT